MIFSVDGRYSDVGAVGDAVCQLLSSNQAIFTRSALEHANEYIAADEFEMALEGSCLELMHNPEVRLADLYELESLAKQLGLDKESVCDSDFRANFTAALEARAVWGDG